MQTKIHLSPQFGPSKKRGKRARAKSKLAFERFLAILPRPTAKPGPSVTFEL